MKKYFIVFCLLIVAYNVFSQSVYTYDPKKDIIIGSAALGLAASSFFIKNSVNNASKDAVFNKDSVNAFDRGLMYKYDKALSIAGDVIVYGFAAAPLLSLTGNYKDGGAWLTYGIMYAQSALFVFGTTEILKKSILRYRPYCYFEDIPSGTDSDYYKSFPSRHTAFAFNAAGFLTATFFAEYPDSPWKIPLCAAGYTLAAGIGASRIFSGNHFTSDVLTGALIGSVSGYLIPWLHLRKKMDNMTIALAPNGFVVFCRL